MPIDRDPDGDARMAALGRRWFAELRQRERDEAAAEKTQAAKAEARNDASLFDWLFGDDDADDGGACGGD